MAHYNTFRSDSTSTDTRISTFLIGTGFGKWTIRIHSAFWSTCWRTSNIIRYTRAYSLAIDFSALTIWTARRWMAWILNDRSWKSSVKHIIQVRRKFSCSKYAYFSQVDIGLMHFLRIRVDMCTLECEIQLRKSQLVHKLRASTD